MKYSSINVATTSFAGNIFKPELIETPAWFQPFWNEIVNNQILRTKGDIDFRMRVAQLYAELAPFFDEYDAVKNYKDQPTVYAIYARTIIVFHNALPDKLEAAYSIARLIAEMQDLDFIKVLLQYEYHLDQCHGGIIFKIFSKYIEYSIVIQNFDSNVFLQWFAELVANAYDDRYNSRPRHANAIMHIHSCITGVAQGYMEHCHLLDARDLDRLLPVCNQRQQQSLCRSVIEYAMLEHKLEVADHFWKLLPDKTECFAVSNENYAKYKDSKHYFINNYLYRKNPNPGFAYSWARNINPDYRANPADFSKNLQIELILAAARGGCLPAIHYIIEGYKDTEYKDRDIDMSARMPEFAAILDVGANQNHQPSIRLLAAFLRQGKYIKMDLPAAISLYAKLNDHLTIVDIYRNGPVSIRNNAAAFAHYKLALDQVRDKEKSEQAPILHEIALAHLYGRGTEVDVKKATDILHDLSVNYAYPAGYETLAEVYRTGIPGIIPVDIDKAREYCKLNDDTFFGPILCNFASVKAGFKQAVGFADDSAKTRAITPKLKQ